MFSRLMESGAAEKNQPDAISLCLTRAKHLANNASLSSREGSGGWDAAWERLLVSIRVDLPSVGIAMHGGT